MKKNLIIVMTALFLLGAVFNTSKADRLWGGWTNEKREEVYEIMENSGWLELSDELNFSDYLAGSHINVRAED